MSSTIAKVYELSKPLNLYLKEQKLPEPIANEIQAETVVSALSPGTEVAAYRGANPLKVGRQYPRVQGYCNVAVVTKIGRDVTTLKPGDHILTFQSHRSAFNCSEYDFVIKIPENINLQHAATAYLYHLGLHGLITADTRFGHHVAVIGLGTLGYTTCVMSRLSGASTFAITNQQASVDKLTNSGVRCFNKNTDNIPSLLQLTHGTGIDIVINTSNHWHDWRLALELVNKGGTIVNIGFPGRDLPVPNFNPLDANYAYVKNLTIKSLCHLSESEVPPYEFRFTMKRNLLHILDLIQDGRLNPNDIISAVVPYTKLSMQYEKYLNGTNTMFSTILNWK
jgi:threonine dehydrogenase-like Zn-dependent dehydrogenase